jgi:hypothetical protein
MVVTWPCAYLITKICDIASKDNVFWKTWAFLSAWWCSRCLKTNTKCTFHISVFERLVEVGMKSGKVEFKSRTPSLQSRMQLRKGHKSYFMNWTWDFQKWKLIIWWVSSSGIWRRLVRWVWTDVSEVLSGFLLNFLLRPWRWPRYVPPKRRSTLNGLHGVISQKMILIITTAVKTSHPNIMIFWLR